MMLKTYTPQGIEAAFIAVATGQDRLIIQRDSAKQQCRILLELAGSARRVDLTSRLAIAFALPTVGGAIGYTSLLAQVIGPLARVSGPITHFTLI